MIRFISHETPAYIYKMKIDDLSVRMRTLAVRAQTPPMKSIMLFGILQKNFKRLEKEARFFCSCIGQNISGKAEEKVMINMLYTIKRLSRIRDRAHELVEDSGVNHLLERNTRALSVAGALYTLSPHDRDLIEHNPVLKEDMARLFTSLLSDSMSGPCDWKNLVSHMVIEVKTCFDEEARMLDEGPCSNADEGCPAHNHMDEYPQLRSALESVHNTHFPECP